jgi:hypothetical protein
LLRELKESLHGNAIKMIDTQSAFDSVFKEHHTKLYPLDDGYWNITAVQLTARLVVHAIDSSQKGDVIPTGNSVGNKRS